MEKYHVLFADVETSVAKLEASIVITKNVLERLQGAIGKSDPEGAGQIVDVVSFHANDIHDYATAAWDSINELTAPVREWETRENAAIKAGRRRPQISPDICSGQN